MSSSPLLTMAIILTTTVIILIILGAYLYRVHKTKVALRGEIVELTNVVDTYDRSIETVRDRERTQPMGELPFSHSVVSVVANSFN